MSQNKPSLERPRWSCALGGALATAGAVPQMVPILHCGPGCAGNFAWTNNGASGLAVTGPCLGLSVPSSNLQEKEVIFGGLDRLAEEIESTMKIMEGEIYHVLTGCVPEVIGDDVESLVSELAGRGYPVIMTSAAGFKGNSYLGYEEVLKTIIKSVVQPRSFPQPDLVNVWGIVPGTDVFWRGNLNGIRDLLSLLGFRANLFFGPEASLGSIKEASCARLNVVLSDVYGLEAAKLFRELYGVDYVVAPLPFGATASERFIKTVGKALGLGGKVIKEVVARAGRQHYEYLEPIIDAFNDMEVQRHALVIGDANYAPALTSFLADDLGWLPELVVVTDDLGEKQVGLERDLRKRLNWKPEKIIFENSYQQILSAAREIWPKESGRYSDTRRPLLIAGSSLDRALAEELGAGHLSLSYPVSNRAVLNRGYTGYQGGLSLTEDFVSACIAQR